VKTCIACLLSASLLFCRRRCAEADPGFRTDNENLAVRLIFSVVLTTINLPAGGRSNRRLTLRLLAERIGSFIRTLRPTRTASRTWLIPATAWLAPWT
jgi:hypothetical protein